MDESSGEFARTWLRAAIILYSAVFCFGNLSSLMGRWRDPLRFMLRRSIVHCHLSICFPFDWEEFPRVSLHSVKYWGRSLARDVMCQRYHTTTRCQRPQLRNLQLSSHLVLVASPLYVWAAVRGTSPAAVWPLCKKRPPLTADRGQGTTETRTGGRQMT